MITPLEIKRVFSLLEKEHQPTMLETLKNYTPFQKVVMTLLSSRTKDTKTIPLVKKLFSRYKLPEDFIRASISELEKALYGIGFYRVKARNVQKLSRIIVDKYNGSVPSTFGELTSLPGVGRKTANCVLAYTFNQPAIAVDTHVHRIANRLGWVKTKNPEKTEAALQEIVPQALWKEVNKLLVDHGQRICVPIIPKCHRCVIREFCLFGRMQAP